MLHGHGNDKYLFDSKIVADFSSNVWFKSLPETFFEHIAAELKCAKDYPNPEAADLKRELAEIFPVSMDNMWVCNGSVEGIYLLAQLFAGNKSAIVNPCFSEYEDACKGYNHQLTFYHNKTDFTSRKFKENFIWIGNPNNPDGKIIEPLEIEKLLINNPSSTFIVDEAYANLTIGFSSSVPLLLKYNNLIILQSFTKTFAIPGIRLGFVFASKKVIQRLAALSIPWSVNALAISAGKFIASNYGELLPQQNELAKWNSLFYEKLNKIRGLKIHPSQSNFFLVEMKTGNAGELKTFLIEKHGILIRDASNFRGLDSRFFRLSVQSENEMDLLVVAIKDYFNAIS